MNAYKQELIKGLKAYGEKFADVEEAKFFLTYAHQIAYDEGRYDLFEACFPNFFEYRFSEAELIEMFGA